MLDREGAKKALKHCLETDEESLPGFTNDEYDEICHIREVKERFKREGEESALEYLQDPIGVCRKYAGYGDMGD